MEFEFDPEKSEANRRKHGIDFVRAQAIWKDPDRLQVPARTEGEARFMLIGKVGTTYWSAIFSFRGERVRIISVRRSRPGEAQRYED